MTYINKDELIKFLTTRMKSFEERIHRDFAGGISDDLGRYREAKLLKKFVESGKFDIHNK